MEILRLRQAQKLIKEAGGREVPSLKLKSPHEGIINSSVYEKCLNELIEAEEFIYSSRPSHKLDNENAKQFCDKIINIRNNLDEILADFGVIQRENVENEIRKLSESVLILTTKTNFKKIFIKYGSNPQNIVVTGVPLEAKDMKVLNPKIPDAALAGISKKIEHVKNDIKRKKDNFSIKKVLVIVEKDDAGELLAKRAEEYYSAHVILEDNLKDISADEFKKMIS